MNSNGGCLTKYYDRTKLADCPFISPSVRLSFQIREDTIFRLLRSIKSMGGDRVMGEGDEGGAKRLSLRGE